MTAKQTGNSACLSSISKYLFETSVSHSVSFDWACDRILMLTCTIAYLEGIVEITLAHVVEAVCTGVSIGSCGGEWYGRLSVLGGDVEALTPV